MWILYLEEGNMVFRNIDSLQRVGNNAVICLVSWPVRAIIVISKLFDTTAISSAIKSIFLYYLSFFYSNLSSMLDIYMTFVFANNLGFFCRYSNMVFSLIRDYF